MEDGLELIIVGIAGKTLEHIASDDELFEAFGDDDQDFFDFSMDGTSTPRLSYFADPHADYVVNLHYLKSAYLSSGRGAALGYVIYGGSDYDDLPIKLDERIFARIPELKQRFITEVESKGIHVPKDKVGVYAVYSYDL